MAKKETTVTIDLAEVKPKTATVHIVGTSSIICNKMDDVTKRELMDERKDKTKKVEKVNKWEKIITSIHWKNGKPAEFTEDTMMEQLDPAVNQPCFTTFGFKKAMCDAVVRFGIDTYSTKFKAAVSMNSKNGLIPFTFSDYQLRDELMSPKRGAPILVYINEFGGWEADITFSYIEKIYSLEQIVNIINLTGIGIGIGSGRNAEYGRFKVTGCQEVA